MKLFVGNLPNSCSELALSVEFERFGPCRVDFFVRFTQGRFAFVEFLNTLHAEAAMKFWATKTFLGSQLKVDKAYERTEHESPDSQSISPHAHCLCSASVQSKSSPPQSPPGISATVGGPPDKKTGNQEDDLSDVESPDDDQSPLFDKGTTQAVPCDSSMGSPPPADSPDCSRSPSEALQSPSLDCGVSQHSFIEDQQANTEPFEDQEHLFSELELPETLRKSTRVRRTPHREEMVATPTRRSSKRDTTDGEETGLPQPQHKTPTSRSRSSKLKKNKRLRLPKKRKGTEIDLLEKSKLGRGEVLKSPDTSHLLRAYDGTFLEAVDGPNSKRFRCTLCERDVKKKSIYAHLRTEIHQLHVNR